MPRLIAFVWALIVVSLSVQAAESETLQWLDRMASSVRELNYRGTFAYEHDGVMESLRIDHAVYGGEEYERLQYLDGEPVESLAYSPQPVRDMVATWLLELLLREVLE